MREVFLLLLRWSLTDAEDDHLCLDSIELAVGNAPENVLGAVAADAVVVGVSRLIVLPPHLTAVAAPVLHGAGAQKDDRLLGGMLLGNIEQVLVPVQEASVRARGGDPRLGQHRSGQ